MKVEDSSSVLNKLNTSELSLNTSRGRLRRDSHGKANGKSSSSEENSPIVQRKARSNITEKKSVTKIETSKPFGSTKSTPNDLKKRSDSFVLDVSSIMTELQMAGSSSHTEDDEDEDMEVAIPTKRRGEMNGTQTPPTATSKLDPPPLAKSKIRKLQTETVRKTTLMDVGRTAKDTDIDKPEKPPPSPSRKVGSRLSTSDLPKALQESRFSADKPPPSPSRSVTRRVKDETTPSRSKLEEDVSKSANLSGRKTYAGGENRVNTTTRGVANSSSEDRWRSTADDGVKTTRSTANGGSADANAGEEEVQPRTRANALAGKRQESVRRDTDEMKNSDQFDEKGLSEVGHRARLGSKDVKGSKDATKRSGSFSLRRQMSGDRALGMFYHHKRQSQLVEHDSSEDLDKKSEFSPERLGSLPSPQSPVASRTYHAPTTTPTRGVRDSEDLNAQGAAPSPSPLCRNSDTSESFRTKRTDPPVTSGATGIPLSPRIVVSNNVEEVSLTG